MKIRLLMTALLFAGTPFLGGDTPRIQAADAPWQTLRTAHYVIHFPSHGDFQPFAREVAAKIEGIHAQVVAWVGFEIPRPIQVLIRDPQLEANGSAWPFTERPWVELWKTQPEPEAAIGHFDSWVDLLVTHELTHLHHLLRPQNQRTWWDKVLNLPVGPVTRKAPRWVIEGYATVIEGKITGSGRPHGAYRASLLRQWALQGKLPDYGTISGFSGFRGGSMAYLVGSAYLEWLERQNPGDPDILKKLWKQLASKKRSGFDSSFKATFGMDARDGYDRWRAEVTHDALELEKRAKKQNLLQEGEVWARIEGEVTDLAVSPDGSKLLGRVLTRDFRGLCVWALSEKKADPPPVAPTSPKQKEEPTDLNEVQDRAPAVPGRRAKWSLGRVAGRVPEKPTWVDNTQVRFVIRQPNEEGSLERKGLIWNPAAASSQRIVSSPILAPAPAAEESGRHAFEPVPDALGWNIYQRDAEPIRPVTRTLSAALAPAPTPDGRWLYYTQLTATGAEIRKLDLSLPALDDARLTIDAEPLAPETVISKADEPTRLPAAVAPAPATDYRVGDSLWNHSRSGLSLGPSGESLQFGYGGSDLLGRLSWLALAGVGDGAGSRGAALAAVWRGWRWSPSLAVFSVLERPSAQKFAPIAGFDRERRGAEGALTFVSRNSTPILFQPFVAFERVEFPGAHLFMNRVFAGLGFGIAHRWLKGEHLACTLEATVSGASGRTDGRGWNLQRGELSLRFANKVLPIALKSELARVGGTPTALDRLRLGGVGTSLVPATLDLNRFDQPALPSWIAAGDRARRWRGDLGSGLRAYVEHTQIWSFGQRRAAAARVMGVEAALHELLPTELAAAILGRIELTMGLHRPLDGSMKDRTVGTVSLIVRP